MWLLLWRFLIPVHTKRSRPCHISLPLVLMEALNSMHGTDFYGYISDTMANVYIDGEPCPQSIVSEIANSVQAVSTVLHDSDPDTCLFPTNMAKRYYRILIPSFTTSFGVIGHRITCGAAGGLFMFQVIQCDEGACRLSQCYPSHHYMIGDLVVCRFRCVQTFGYTYALLDISIDTLNINAEICEVAV